MDCEWCIQIPLPSLVCFSDSQWNAVLTADSLAVEDLGWTVDVSGITI